MTSPHFGSLLLKILQFSPKTPFVFMDISKSRASAKRTLSQETGTSLMNMYEKFHEYLVRRTEMSGKTSRVVLRDDEK